MLRESVVRQALMDPHTNRELKIFREFAAVCPLQVEVDSIEKRDPPEADILCKLADGTAVAFEMVELVDQQRIARPLADQAQLMDSMPEAAKTLPEETRNQLTNAWVGVKFRPDKSLRKRKEFAVQIVRELAAHPAFEGELQVQDRNEQVAVADVRRRDGLAGPHFHVLAAGHYRPVPMDALDEKFEKQYPGDIPIQLLAHYDRQHAPLEEQIAELAAHIEANIGRSSFSRVWIFDRHNQRICC